jgi:hypothetical protein
MATVDTDFDTKAAALVRRRKMAELLQAESLKPFAGAGNVGRTSFLEPLGQIAKAFAGAHMGKGIDTEEAANEAARETAFQDVMKRRPMGTPEIPAVPATPDRPGAPAIPGETRPPSPMLGEQQTLDAMFNQAAPTPSLSELGPQPMPKLAPAQPAGPMIPGTPEIAAVPAKRATTAEMIPWAADLARTTATGKDLAKQVYANLIPKELTPEQIEDMKLRRELQAATLENTRVNQMAENERKMQAARDILADKKSSREDKERADKALIDGRIEVARIMAGAVRDRGSKGDDFKITTSIDNNGRALREKNGVHYQVRSDGTISDKPYAGAVTPQSVHEKSVEAIRKGDEAIRDMESISKAVTADPAIYGTRAQWASHAPTAFGMQKTASGLDVNQSAIRSQAAAMTAVYTHSLYGASFSGTEQAKAKGFVINDNDPPEEVQRKLKGRMDLEKEHMLGRPAAAQSAYAQRAPGAAPAAGDGSGPSAGWGKATPVGPASP